MFTSLKNFINSRLGVTAIDDEFTNTYGYFIKTQKHYFYSTMFFLKNDPDMGLSLLDQIIALPMLLDSFSAQKEGAFSLLYQLKSLKLPYRVSLVLEMNHENEFIQSIRNLYPGAKWQEEDIAAMYNIVIEEGIHSEIRKS